MVKKTLVLIVVIIAAVLIFWAVSERKDNNLPSVRQDEPLQDDHIISQILNQAVKEEAGGNLPKAYSLYSRLVMEFPNSPQISSWQKKTGDLNIRLLFSPTLTPGSVLYEIKPGDSLAKIAKKFHTTVELLKKSNNLSSDVIITGKKLKAWTKPFNIIVDKSQNTLILKSEDEILKMYTVSTGASNSTPVGIYKIINKLVNPSWFKAGAVVPPESPDNILGSRWMGFDLEGYGIHGTTEPETLGKQITAGCVRMANSQVEELFTIVPVGTEVTIVD
ncbi:MAG: L,D-transpeptidase family protein [Candidatus Omnitrophica bacterium]|nr:L,D-transpeptidase family protein [Candidatus Omnitrophota bacterium]